MFLFCTWCSFFVHYCTSIAYIRNQLCVLVRPVMYVILYRNVRSTYISGVFRTSLYRPIIHYLYRMYGSTNVNVCIFVHQCTMNTIWICLTIHYCPCILYIPSVLCTKLHTLLCQNQQKQMRCHMEHQCMYDIHWGFRIFDQTNGILHMSQRLTIIH